MMSGNNRSPEQKYEEAKLAYAVYQMLKQENEESLRALSDEDRISISKAARDSLGSRLAMIEKEVCKHKGNAVLRKRLAVIIRVIAAVALVLNIAVGIAFAASAEFRRDVVTFLMSINDSYAEMELENPDVSSVPVGVSDIYMPSYMPEGYSLCSYNRTAFSVMYSWENGIGDIISFEMYSENAKSRISAEGAELSTINLRGTIADVIKQPYGETSIIWFECQNYIIVTAPNEELAIKIAESTEFTNN